MSRVLSLTCSLAVGAGLSSSACSTIVGADFDVTPRPASTMGPPNPSPTVSAGPSRVASWSIGAPDGDAQLLGLSVAVEGDTILAGARTTPGWAGRAYVATRSFDGTWQIEQTLTAEEYAAPNAQFGSAIALSGDWAVIGASGDKSSVPARSGSAFFFHRQGGSWLRAEPPVQAPAPAPDDAFGARVAVDGDLAVVGAPGNPRSDSYAGRTGAVYVYTLGTDGTWSLSDTIAPADGAAGDQFGFELALDSGALLVGAPGAAERGADAGAAYSFGRHGSSFDHTPQKLLPRATDATGTRFGYGTIGLDGDLLIVPAAVGPPQAYALDASGTWQPDVLSPPPFLAGQTTAGWRAALRGSTAVLSVRVSLDVGTGIVYRRANGAWQAGERLVSGSSPEDVFGWTLAYDGSTACFGAIFSNGREGAVYVFDPPI